MPLFAINQNQAQQLSPSDFALEKELQTLIERNLDVFFNCRFVATEFSTGAEHAGRMDTLALSEDNNPVIIEYKKVESSDLLNQSLFYLKWLHDHHADFELAVQRSLGEEVQKQIDWSDIRVICIAPGYKKYDLYAVEVMGANIELWDYNLYDKSFLNLNRIFPKNILSNKTKASFDLNQEYTLEYHLEGKSKDLQMLTNQVREFILGLEESIVETYKKLYIAYKTTQNAVCMIIQKNKIVLYLKLDPLSITEPPPNFRNMKDKDHFGTGDVELTISSDSDFEISKALIERACK